MQQVHLGLFPMGTTADIPRAYGLYYTAVFTHPCGYIRSVDKNVAHWRLIGRKKLTTSQLGITSVSFYRLLRGIR